jgi:hypothetical protein
MGMQQQQQQQKSERMHFAVEADVAGYVSLGFPEDPAKMHDADMILG